jgi:5-methyltetrahydrofolate corrinoid/iron sulfur protein methyltransferase
MLVRQCVEGGADVLEINTQQHYDRPEVVEFAVRFIEEAAGRPLCLSSLNAEALEAGLRCCKRPALVNHLSLDPVQLQKVLPLVARYKAEIVLLVNEPGVNHDAEKMLKKAAILVGAANEAGVPSSRIIVDPGLMHVSKEPGQRHFAEILDFLRALPDSFDSKVRSTCWLNGVSVGSPRPARAVLETTALAMLATCGLSSVFMNVLSKENRRMLRLTKIFTNQSIYADHDVELY